MWKLKKLIKMISKNDVNSFILTFDYKSSLEEVNYEPFQLLKGLSTVG